MWGRWEGLRAFGRSLGPFGGGSGGVFKGGLLGPFKGFLLGVTAGGTGGGGQRGCCRVWEWGACGDPERLRGGHAKWGGREKGGVGVVEEHLGVGANWGRDKLFGEKKAQTVKCSA